MYRALLWFLIGTTPLSCGRLGYDPEARRGGDAGAAPVDAGGGAGSDDDAGAQSVRGPGQWDAMAPGPLAPRIWTRAVWTGTEFLVFGGAIDSDYNATSTGARYDPASNTWTEMSTSGAPTRRHTPHLVWSGRELLVFGGGQGLGPLSGGGIYDPETDTWREMTTEGMPGLRIYGAAVAVDGRMLIWGGWANDPGHYQSGFFFDPEANTWTAISTDGAPSPRSFATAVWTGADVIVWGGCSGPMGQCPDTHGDGARYDPATDTWSPMSSDGAPSPRAQHTAVWSGREMIVFGGATSGDQQDPVQTGGVYDPEADSWRPLSTDGAAPARSDHAGVWLGDRMVIWGGVSRRADGYLYDPVEDAWSSLASEGAPAGRARFAYAASPEALLVWGGSLSDSTGARWTPSAE